MWYALVSDDQIGPMPEEDLIRLHRQGVVITETQVWREGMARWMPFADVDEFEHLFEGDSTLAVEPGTDLGAVHFPVHVPVDDDDDDDEDSATLIVTDLLTDELGLVSMMSAGRPGGPDDSEETVLARSPGFDLPPKPKPPTSPAPPAPPRRRYPTPPPPPSHRSTRPEPPRPAKPAHPSRPRAGPPPPPPPLSPAQPAPRGEKGLPPPRLDPSRPTTGSVPLLHPQPAERADLDAVRQVEIPVGLAEMLEPGVDEDGSTPARATPAPGMPPLAPAPMTPAPGTPGPVTSALKGAPSGSTMKLAIGAFLLLVVGAAGGLGYLYVTRPAAPEAPPPDVTAAPVRLAPAVVPAVDPADVAVAAALYASPASEDAIPPPTADAAPRPTPLAVTPKVKPRRDWKPARPATRPKTKPAPPPRQPAMPTSLSRQDMVSVLKKNAPRLKSCFDETTPPSTISVAVTIERTGKVGSARVMTSTVRSSPAARCIEGQVKGYRFKPFNGETMRLTMPLSP